MARKTSPEAGVVCRMRAIGEISGLECVPKVGVLWQGFCDLLAPPELGARKLGNLLAVATHAVLAPLLETLLPR